MRLFCILFTVCVILPGCHSYNKRPSDLISQNHYIDLLIELQLLKNYQIEQHPDSSKVDSLQKTIFSKYNVTKDQFKRSDFYYRHNIKKQNQRIQEAIKRLNEDRMTRQDSLEKLDSTRDSTAEESRTK
jgi:hypothetical protein